MEAGGARARIRYAAFSPTTPPCTVRTTLNFEPSARLQSILSRELVADPNVAVLEFVKNSYDAGAAQVLIDFELGDHAHDGVLTIADDGEGMDLESFKQNWMRPGYSEKALPGKYRGRDRVPAGEKGLGRLAAGRLGEVLDVYTRADRRKPWWHAEFVWSDFDDMDQSLTDIGIEIDNESEPDEPVGETGTVVRISGLRLNWGGKVPGRKAPGRHPTRIGRLRQDLETLLLPLTAGGSDFEIWLHHNSTQPEDDPPGKIEPPFLDLIHYRYDFEVVRQSNSWKVKRTIYRGRELLAEPIAQEQDLRPRTKQTAALQPPEGGAALKEVGPFKGAFFYAPDSADRLRKARAPVGVPLYRDGIRVEPYGRPGNDWLGAQARKASRQGYAAIQPAALYGAVTITRRYNADLRSQANREGLIENAAYETFLAICRSEFAQFERVVYDEYLSRGWKTAGEHRQQSAQLAQNYAVTLARSVLHRINTPVASANATLDALQSVINDDVDDETLRAELQDLHDRTARQLARIGGAITRLMEVIDFDPTPTRFDVVDLIEEVLRDRAEQDDDAKVLLDIEDGLELLVELPRAPVEEALSELLNNALEAPRADDAHPEVRISAEDRDRAVRVVVADNGSGVDDKIRSDLFRRATSTKGGIGVGLILIRQLMHLLQGDVELESAGPSGSRFAILLPRESA